MIKIDLNIIYYVAALFVAIILVSILLLLFNVPIFETYKLLIIGSVGSIDKLGDTLMIWVPLTLASTSLIMTFKAGLWNIGVEGQIVAGAVATSFVARELHAPTPVLLSAMLIASVLGGALWGGLVGVLKIKGGVNEIFGGLGLDFVATGMIVYLVIGPWSRKGIASTGGTEPFQSTAWFPTLEGMRLSPLSIVIGVVVLIIVIFIFSKTSFGVKLKATGLNPLAAYRLGIPTSRYLFSAFLIGGGIAGLAGLTQAAAMHHRLVPAISGGYGFLGILVVLLSGFRPALILPITFLFSMISMGSVQWQLRLGLHSSFGGVFQGILVMTVILLTGYQLYRRRQLNFKSDRNK